MSQKALLEWYIDVGVDEVIDDTPTNYFNTVAAMSSTVQHPAANTSAPVANKYPSQAPKISPKAPTKITSSPLHHAPAEAIALARKLADDCKTLDELKNAITSFDGCALKKTASQTIISDGNADANVMVIAGAPEKEEDKTGNAFTGPSGELLDRMLKAIQLDRNTVYLSHAIFWRPPGNRHPSPEEIAICLPFVEKHIALIKPSLLILTGGTAATALLKDDRSISRIRGKILEHNNQYLPVAIKAIPTFHPSYLLNQPSQKRFAWNDLQLIRDFLSSL